MKRKNKVYLDITQNKFLYYIIDAVEEHLKDYESLMKYALKILEDNKNLMEENLAMKKENQECLQGNILLLTENEKLKIEKEKLIDDSLLLIDYNEQIREEKNNLEKELLDIKSKFEIIINSLAMGDDKDATSDNKE